MSNINRTRSSILAEFRKPAATGKPKETVTQEKNRIKYDTQMAIKDWVSSNSLRKAAVHVYLQNLQYKMNNSSKYLTIGDTVDLQRKYGLLSETESIEEVNEKILKELEDFKKYINDPNSNNDQTIKYNLETLAAHRSALGFGNTRKIGDLIKSLSSKDSNVNQSKNNSFKFVEDANLDQSLHNESQVSNNTAYFAQDENHSNANNRAKPKTIDKLINLDKDHIENHYPYKKNLPPITRTKTIMNRLVQNQTTMNRLVQKETIIKLRKKAINISRNNFRDLIHRKNLISKIDDNNLHIGDILIRESESDVDYKNRMKIEMPMVSFMYAAKYMQESDKLVDINKPISYSLDYNQKKLTFKLYLKDQKNQEIINFEVNLN